MRSLNVDLRLKGALLVGGMRLCSPTKEPRKLAMDFRISMSSSSFLGTSSSSAGTASPALDASWRVIGSSDDCLECDMVKDCTVEKAACNHTRQGRMRGVELRKKLYETMLDGIWLPVPDHACLAILSGKERLY